MPAHRLKLFSRGALIGGLWLAAASGALANDTSATIGAGGLQFQQTNDVRMEREDLYLSPREVRVSYVFRNVTDRDVTMTVAFPMPDIDVFDMEETPHEFHLSHKDGDIFDFHVAVNGREIVSDLDARAYRRDRPDQEVTAILKKHKMPLLWEVPRGATMAPDKDALAAEGLLRKLDGDPNGDLHANWIVKANFHWQQTFPAGQATRITHRYKPVTGFSWGLSLGDVCPDKAFDAALKALPANSDNLVPSERLDYILKTGGNWAGPIGRFRLEISKGRADLVSLCPVAGLKLQRHGQSFVAEASEYVPTTDIKLLFVYRACAKAPCAIGDSPPGLRDR